ncbi:MAG: DNA-processing protein DprA, partial [Rhodobacteraceae bacterium]|nr:DNA-processing protein DprA [Paracoccaceae bacterium]
MPDPDQPGLDFGVPAPAWRAPETEADRLAWLRLARSENVGPITFQRLLTRYGAISKAVEAAPSLPTKSGGKLLILRSYEQAAAEMEAGRALGAELVCLGEPAYPALLTSIDAPPPLLWVLGDPGLLSRPSLAVVGARNAS